MSSFQPYIDSAYPIYPAEEAARPYEAAPVPEVTPGSAARGADAEENRPEAETLPPAAEATLSAAARERARKAMNDLLAKRLSGNEEADRADPVYSPEQARNSPALRELVAAFAQYDNSAAVRRYDEYLNLFARYGSDYDAATVDTGETDPLADMRARENLAYAALGISYAGETTRDIRERIGEAVDRWLTGEGVFSPALLEFPSSDGFRFEPMSEAAQVALRSAEVFATYERQRIAGYLREMAELTPNDFSFYDPTGLTELTLTQRREFLDRVDRLLEEEALDARAAELRYVFGVDGELEVEEMRIRDEAERARIEELAQQITGYYGELLASVGQYKQGIVSESIG